MQARLLLASLLLWTFGAQAQSLLRKESFEVPGEGTAYNSTTFDLRATLPAQYFTREDNPVQTPSGTYTFGLGPTGSTITNLDGTFFWASEGVKGQNTTPDRAAQTVTLSSVNITGYNTIQVKVKFADARGAGYFNPVPQWENNDYVRVRASVDGGPFVIIGQFVGDNPTASTAGNLRQDLDQNLVATGASSDNLSAPVLTQNMQDFTFNVSGTGSSIRVQVEVDQLGGTEELAFDDIRVYGTASATSPPALANIETGNLPYNEGDPATFVTGALTVGDPDNTTLTGATVSISSGYVSGQDFLRFTNQNGITGNFNAGTLTLSGTATLAAYQAALRSIKYENTETVNATGGNRTVTFTATDGTNTSNAVIRTIAFVAELNAPAALPYVEDFDTNGEGTRYASNAWASSSPCLAFVRTNSNPYPCSPTTFSNISNAWYWYAEGTKNAANPNAVKIGNLEIAPVDATNYGNLIFNVRLGTGQSAQWDNTDFVKFYYKVGSGANVLFAAFYGNAVSSGELQRDTDLNGSADGTILNSNLQNFALALPANITGSSVGFFIEVSNDGQEELAMDRINITGTINNAPVIGAQTRSVAENSGNGTNVGAVVTASDPDANTLSYSIIGGNTNGTFAINSSTGQITVANSGALNFEATPTYSLTVQVSDNGTPSANASATVTVNVTNVNEAPSISPQSFGIAENSANGSVVGAVTASDPDASTTLTYSITNGNTGGAFTFVGNSLRVANSAALDFETTPTFSLTVQVTDGSLTASATVTVNLSDVAEGPTAVGLSPQSLPENQPVNTAVGNFSTTGPGSGYTYTLVGGAGSGGNSAFSISGGQLRTAVAFDFETQSSYAIRVRSTDNANAALFFEQNFTITITNVNEAPSISPQTFAIAENSANGSVVGTVVASDPDGTTPTYSITAGNTGGAFSFVGNSLRVANSGALNFETTPTFSLTVQVTDGSLTDVATITVNLTNVNEAPSISPQTLAIAENSANGTVVGTVVASDPDGTSPSYSITGGNTGGAFTLVGNSLRVANSAALNFETTPTFSLTVQVSDGSLTDVATITVNLTNVNEAPSISPQTLSIAENSANGSVVGTVVASDPDGTTPSYSITGGNTGGAFTFVGSSLRVANSATLDFETTPTFSLTVQVSDGSLTDVATITVNLTNVNEAPSISPQTFAIDENSASNTVVGTVIASDPDGTTPTYSITGGNTGNAFILVGSSLRVGNAAALDFETTPTFSLTVQVSDGSLTDVATITVNLNNLDDTAPLAPVVSAPTNNSLINDQTPTYSGTAEANSTVTVIVDGSSIGTTTATGGGAWSLMQPTPLADGPHTVRATATDAANNTGPSSTPRNFTVDATAPSVTINSGATSPTTVTPIPFSITFSESVISFFPSDITVLNGTVTGFSGSGTSYSFSVVPTAPGNVQVNVPANVAQDAATNGNDASPTFIIVYALPATSTTWLGGGTNNWFTASNWSDGVPTSTLDAIIPGGLPLPYPIISSGAGNTRDLTIGNGGSLTLNGGELDISRDFTNDGTFNPNTGMVQLNGNSQQTIGGSATTTFYDLLVGDSGANLTAAVHVSHVLQVNGNVASGGNLTLLSTATATAMVVNSGGVISGQSTVQRWVDGSLNAGSGYRHMSAPVSNTTFADLAATGFTPVVNAAYNSAPNPLSVTPYPNVFGFNEARFPTSSDFTRGYFSPTALTDPMVRGRAYSVYFPGNRAVDFVGTLSTGNVTVTGLTRTGNFAAAGQKSGWQLLGNPYPSPIDWDLVTLPSGLSPSISVYRSTGGVNGTYTQYVNGVGPAGSDIVAVGQGFFALVTSGSPLSLTFTNACRVTDYVSPTFGRPGAGASADTETRSIVGLRVKAANAPAKQVADETYVYFEAGATDGIDAQYDAVKFQHALGLPTLVSMAGTTEMGVNGLPEAVLATTGTTVPLTLDAPRAGQYVIEVARMANLNGTAVALLDRLTNTRYDLATTPSVQLSVAQPGVVSGRFELVVGRRLSTAPGVALTATLAPNPAHTQAKLLLNQPLATATTVTLHDAVGRVILTQSLAEGTSEATLDLRSLPVGVYVVRCGSLTSRLVVE